MVNLQKARTFISVCRKTIAILTIFILLFFASHADSLFSYMRITAYCPCNICCGDWADGYTSTMAKAGKGSIAIDPNGIFQMGDVLYIEGYGFGVCNDTGSAIKGNKIDLCYDTHEEALEWGVRYKVVWLVRRNKEQYWKGVLERWAELYLEL